jgi:hypothetical protein
MVVVSECLLIAMENHNLVLMAWQVEFEAQVDIADLNLLPP